MTLAEDRDALRADTSLRGRAFSDAWRAKVDPWLAERFAEAVAAAGVDGSGLALVAVGGYGRGDLAPASDLDLLLLHDHKSPPAAVAEKLWYPIWDEGMKLGHSVRTTAEALDLAATDLDTATSLLSARHLAGEVALTEELATMASAQWRKRSKRYLGLLRASVAARRDQFGEVAFLLEPDLKEGHGGLRDIHALRWAEAARPILEDGDAAALVEAETGAVRRPGGAAPRHRPGHRAPRAPGPGRRGRGPRSLGRRPHAGAGPGGADRGVDRRRGVGSGGGLAVHGQQPAGLAQPHPVAGAHDPRRPGAAGAQLRSVEPAGAGARGGHLGHHQDGPPGPGHPRATQRPGSAAARGLDRRDPAALRGAARPRPRRHLGDRGPRPHRPLGAVPARVGRRAQPSAAQRLPPLHRRPAPAGGHGQRRRPGGPGGPPRPAAGGHAAARHRQGARRRPHRGGHGPDRRDRTEDGLLRGRHRGARRPVPPPPAAARRGHPARPERRGHHRRGGRRGGGSHPAAPARPRSPRPTRSPPDPRPGAPGRPTWSASWCAGSTTTSPVATSPPSPASSSPTPPSGR